MKIEKKTPKTELWDIPTWRSGSRKEKAMVTHKVFYIEMGGKPIFFVVVVLEAR